MSPLLLSVVMPARNASTSLKSEIPKLIHRLEQRFGSSFEVILVVNGFEGPGPLCLTEKAAVELSRHYEQVKMLRLDVSVNGKGAALQQGVAQAVGQSVLLLDADVPFGLESIEELILELKKGAEFVTCNRRLPESRFSVPTRLLHLAYRRHLVGLRFNSMVRIFFPSIPTRDTQAGMKALSSGFAKMAFSRITSTGFFYDIELFLMAEAQGKKWKEIPVTYRLDSETSTMRLFQSLVLVFYWLPKIWWHKRSGYYA